MLNNLQESSAIEQILESFSKRLRIKSDDNKLSYYDFRLHLQTLQKLTSKIELSINSIVCDGETVFTHHTASVHKAGASAPSLIEIMARFSLKDARIVRCTELSRVGRGGR